MYDKCDECACSVRSICASFHRGYFEMFSMAKRVRYTLRATSTNRASKSVNGKNVVERRDETGTSLSRA